MELELKEESWLNIFDVIRNNNLKVSGNFWAAIQRLEEQYENKRKV